MASCNNFRFKSFCLCFVFYIRLFCKGLTFCSIIIKVKLYVQFTMFMRIVWKGRPRNDLYCVGRDVKPFHSLTHACVICASVAFVAAWFSFAKVLRSVRCMRYVEWKPCFNVTRTTATVCCCWRCCSSVVGGLSHVRSRGFGYPRDNTINFIIRVRRMQYQFVWIKVYRRRYCDNTVVPLYCT